MNDKLKRNKGLVSLGIIMITLTAILINTRSVYSQNISEPNKSDSISQILAKVVNDEKAPGIIAAIISGDGIIAIGSAGVRKFGTNIPFSINDVVHLGSCSKAMTAAMIATLVAEGKLSWETKLIDAIPELKNSIHPDYHNVTLWQLLTHRAGFPDLWTFNQSKTKERRLSVLKEELKSPGREKSGEFHYSNLGYMAAACMAEQITGLSWEVLMKKCLFDPLGMSSAGFGFPGTPNQTDQPWGHQKSWNNWQPIQSDCSEALGPAGRIHCTIEDWAKFLSLQLTNKNQILDQKYLNKLIEPVDFYAGGWGVGQQNWAKGNVLSHNGSNGNWYTSVLVAPALGRAFVVSTNSRDFGVTEDLCNKIISKMVKMELNAKNN